MAKGASEADIKKAFRKAAKQHHPDANKNDPKAQDKFAEVNTAYEILGDAEKRRKFDAGEIDAEGKPKFSGFEGFDFGGGRGGRTGGGFGGGQRPTEDILNDIFGDAFAGFASAGGRGQKGGRRRTTAADFDFGTGPGAAGMGGGGAKGADTMVTARVRLEDLVGSGKVGSPFPPARRST